MKNKTPISVIITDTHLRKDNFQQVKSVIQQAIQVAKDKKCESVIHLGDHFVNRASQDLETVLDFMKLLDMFVEDDIIFETFPGNHDKSDQTVNESWLSVFKNYAPFHVKIYEDSSSVDVTEEIVYNFLPYYKDEIYQEKLMNLALEPDKKNVLFTHQGISGVLDNDGVKVSNSINKQCFSVFDKVFIGHFHNHSRVDKNIEFIGSTDSRTYGEDENKGCVILYDDLSTERINFNFKKFKTIKITEEEIINIDKIVSEYKNSGDNVRLCISGNRDELVKVDKTKLNNLGFEVVLTDTELIIIEEENEKVTLRTDRKELRKDFIGYCENKEIPKNEFVDVLKKI